jgi:hypothetical protein
MKIETERALMLVLHWANGAIAFGVGYWMLSYLESGVALMIALGLASLGAFTKLVVHSRLHRLHESTSESSRQQKL